MPTSAFVGQHPVSINDKLVHRGILLVLGPSFLKKVTELPHTSQQNKASSLIIGSSFAIILIILITCSRLWVRKFRLRSFKADDWVIIPAAIGCVTFLSSTIAIAKVGCLGKHVQDCTYDEFGRFYEVSEASYQTFGVQKMISESL